MSIEEHILSAKRAAAEDMYEALNTIDNWLVCAAIASPEDMAQSFASMHDAAANALTKATYIVRDMCPNCDTELPEGCGGQFSSEGAACRWNDAK